METLYFPINFLINLKLLKKQTNSNAQLVKTIGLKNVSIKFKNVKKRH